METSLVIKVTFADSNKAEDIYITLLRSQEQYDWDLERMLGKITPFAGAGELYVDDMKCADGVVTITANGGGEPASYLAEPLTKMGGISVHIMQYSDYEPREYLFENGEQVSK